MKISLKTALGLISFTTGVTGAILCERWFGWKVLIVVFLFWWSFNTDQAKATIKEKE